MFDKFGEFHSFEELNKAATGFKKEWDVDSLNELAIENGLDEEDVQDYIDGIVDELTTEPMAAIGRLKVETKETKDAAGKLIIEMTKGMVTIPEIAEAVMKKGKRTEEILKAMRDGASRHMNGRTGTSCGTDRELQEIIKTYYLGTEEELTEKIEGLYK